MIETISLPGLLAVLIPAALLLALVCLVISLRLLYRRHALRPDQFSPDQRDIPQNPKAPHDEFLAALGHELYSPLHALLNLLETDTSIPEAPRRELQALAAHALHVAEASLSFGLLGRGSLQLKPARMNLERALTEVLTVVRPLRPKEVALKLDLMPGLPIIRHGDATRLKQIFVNLIANAFAYTRQGAVCISIGPMAGDPIGVRFVVADSGLGMTPAERNRAFMPFEQGDIPHGKAGIGLALVARIVDTMAGKVQIESELGIGSQVTVDLPLPIMEEAALTNTPRLVKQHIGVYCTDPDETRSLAAHLRHWQADPVCFAAPEELAEQLRRALPLDALVLVVDTLDPDLAKSLIKCEANGLLIIQSTPDDVTARLPGTLLAALTQRTSNTSIATHLAGLEVLVIDDHPLARRTLHKFLSESGCRVTCAEDGTSAVEIARDLEEHFDWVLLDRRMPGLDGLATAALLREAQATRNACIILLINEAADDPGSPELFDQVLVRPHQPESLRALLNLVLSTSSSPSRSGPQEAWDPSFIRLRDQCLHEDLSNLTTAIKQDDNDGITGHLHRMENALRLCPDPFLDAALQTLQSALKHRDGHLKTALQAFSKQLDTSAH